MADREYSVVLKIEGELRSSLQAAMKNAKASVQGLNRAALQSTSHMNRLQRELSQQTGIKSMRQLQQAISQASPQYVQMRLKAGQLRQELANQEKQVNEYRNQLQRLKEVRSNTTDASQRRVMGEQIRQATAELRQHEAQLTATRNNYRQQNSQADTLNSSIRRQQQELRQLQSALQAAGVSASQMSQSESQLQRQIDQTNQRIQTQQNFHNARQNHTASTENVTNAYGNFQGALGTAQSIMSPITNAVSEYADFDAAMSEVRAITGATADDFAKMKELAMELGETTNFQAKDAAAGMTYLGMAGWQTEQIMSGMPAMLNLAQAGNTDLARTADIVSDAMTAFGMRAGSTVRDGMGNSVEATEHFADVLAATSSSANTNVQLMGETFKYAAATAGALGYSVDDVALASGLMANAGIKGSEAGTALRAIMTRMVKPTKESADALQRLGVTAVNEDGSMKPLGQTITELRSAFATLTDSEKAEVAAELAGQEAMSGLLSIVNASGDDFESLSTAIAQSTGRAEEMANIMDDNLHGSLEQMESAAAGARLRLGQIFEPAMRAAADFAAESFGAVSEFITQHQTAVQWVGLLAAGLSGIIVLSAGVQLAFAAWGFIGSTIALITTGITALTARFMALSVVQRIAQGATIAFTAAQAALTAVMAANPIGVAVVAGMALIAVIGGIIALCPGVSEALSAAWNHPQGAVTGFCELVKSTIEDTVNYVIDRWNTLKSALEHPIEAALNFLDHGDVIGGSVVSGEQQRAVTAAHQELSTGGGLGAINQRIEQIDTSGVQQGFDAVAQSAQATADAQNQNAQTGIDTQNLSTNLQTVGTELTNLQTNTMAVDTELTNLSTNTQTLSTDITSASSSIQNFSTSASAAVGSFDQLSAGASAVSSALSAKAAEISSIHISVPQVTTTPVAANAEGGIYRQGAFLTTFAEESPEAAIPLDKSARSVELWRQTGQALGQLPGNDAQPQVNSNAQTRILQDRAAKVLAMQSQPQPQSLPTPEPVPVPVEPLPVVEPPEVRQAAPRLNQNQVDEYLRTGRVTLEKPGEGASAAEIRRYENNERINAALDYLNGDTQAGVALRNREQGITTSEPRTGSRAALEQARSQNQNRRSIFGSRNTTTPQPTLPMTQTVPQNIFSGGLTLPTKGGMFSDLSRNIQNPLQNFSPTTSASATLPPITISVNINGATDGDNLRQAGQEIGETLKRQLDSWWREKQRDESRRSFL